MSETETDKTAAVLDDEQRRLWKEGAKMAIAVQSACNLVAVLGAWRTWLIEARKAFGWEAADKHPVSLLCATQIAWLSAGGTINAPGYHEAYAECERWTKEGT